MLLFAASALAGPIFLEVGVAAPNGTNGNWPRAFPRETDTGEEAWWFTNADQTNYWVSEAGSDRVMIPETHRELAPVAGLIDHGLSRCPDGTFFHAGTKSIDTPDDTLYVFRYDDEFSLLAQATVMESSPYGEVEDPATLCGSWIQGVGYMMQGESSEGAVGEWVLSTYDDDLQELQTVSLEESADAAGSSMYADDDYLWTVGSMLRDPSVLRVARYDHDLALVDSRDIVVVDPPNLAFWYQSTIVVGDVRLVAYIVQAEGEEWVGQTGNVWIAAFDADWNVVDQVQATTISGGTGPFHPFLTRRGDTVYLLYTYEANNWMQPVTIDLAAAGVDGDTDTGVPVDTGPADDTGGSDTDTDTDADTDTDTDADSDTDTDTDADTGTPPDDDAGSCGCGREGTPVGGLLLGLAVVGVRRRAR